MVARGLDNEFTRFDNNQPCSTASVAMIATAPQNYLINDHCFQAHLGKYIPLLGNEVYVFVDGGPPIVSHICMRSQGGMNQV